ncbi:patatin-like phospholipase family protein [Persicitalea sp.]|uniref:patatin-like phospholipase family protein n=1 Tax=Persicitalea sp. TaxID=3100273 RepID=UPI0035935F3B
MTGLVLSGGGARGISHLGAVKALYEHGIHPDIISGTSAGAITGGLLAYGYAPEDILEMILSTSFVRYVRPTFGGSGLLRMDRLEEIYRKYIPENTFECLKTPFVVSATDIFAGETVYFREGELARPVLASSCLPGLFAPMEYQGRHLVDGGVLSNMPVEPLEGVADYIIGVHCNPFKLLHPPRNTREVVYRSLILAVHAKTKERFEKCNLLLEAPQLGDFSVYDLRKARELFVLGYRHAQQVLRETPVLALP